MARRALGPATLSVVQAVEGSLTADDRALLVACSGGPDSLALAAAAAHVVRRRPLVASAVVVDHGLQHDSASTADRAATQVALLGIDDVTVRRVGVEPGSPSGPEAAARFARYRALEEEAVQRDATVLLGHTLDDQAETVLLGLVRGSGTRSLAGMAVRSGRHLRPLLALRRATTVQACVELELEPWHDPHNADPAFTRSRLRFRVLPVLEAELGPGISESLARTASLARADADLLDGLALEAYPGLEEAEGLDCALLLGLPSALRGRVIRRWLTVRGAGELGLDHVRQVEALVTSWHGQLGADLPKLCVRRRHGRLVCLTIRPVAG
jgi:tRNA(Ile)-lysidine synthase